MTIQEMIESIQEMIESKVEDFDKRIFANTIEADAWFKMDLECNK